MIKLVVCDIDNTLVPKHKMPSERTLNCIHEFNNMGILFGLASGRHYDGLKDLADQWGIHVDLYIGMNGAEIYDNLTGEHEIMGGLKKEWLKEIFEIMEPFYDYVNPNTIIDNKRYIRRMDEITAEAFRYSKAGNLPVIVEDESLFWSKDTFKIGFRTTAKMMPLIEYYVDKHPSENYYGVKTEYTMYEFNPMIAQKGMMLERFCRTHNIDIKDTIGIGDMSNDISLIKAAGIGVCMFNGSDDTKAVADVITDLSIEDDGFADYCEKHILNI
ncbi:MAG: HAD family hydrolase [Erysipelotrichaceae bacterium]|nr:HAD family hydrolase [Erysipelotrichaceae bacterium]